MLFRNTTDKMFKYKWLRGKVDLINYRITCDIYINI